MQGGPGNPLGGRALDLSDKGRDTLYRIHGTNEPDKIGQATASACIRMRNIDVVDPFNRVAVGATAIVRWRPRLRALIGAGRRPAMHARRVARRLR